MEIIADRGTEQIFQQLISDPAADGIIVQLEKLDEAGSGRSRMSGFNDVLNRVPSCIPILMVGWQRQARYAEDPRWHAALGYPNVVFRRLPVDKDDVIVALAEAAQGKRPRDPLAIRMLELNVGEDSVRTLAHDLPHAEARGEEALQRWTERASKVLGQKPRQELIAEVKERRPIEGRRGLLAAESFPDLFVDAEGTLLDQSGTLMSEVATLVRAESAARPVTVWTGGSIKDVTTKLRGQGVVWKIASKYWFEGGAVEIALDDLPYKAFLNTYQITVRDYRKL